MFVSSRIYEYLTRIARLLQADERAGAAGLQPVQLHALEYLAHCNRYSDRPAAVADYLRITKGTASQTLGVLESRELIEKRADDKDRRIVRLRITPKGRRVLKRVIPPPLLTEALGELRTQRREELFSALDELLRQLQRVNEGRTFGVCHTCSHFLREKSGKFRCGLTTERLSAADSRRICYEHQPAA